MKNKNNFRILKRFVSSTFFIVAFLPSLALAAVNTDSLMTAFKSYVTVLTVPTSNQVVNPTSNNTQVTLEPIVQAPIVYVTPQPSINEANLLSALRNLLSKKEIANQLRGPQ
ncbi:hypothetical protein, partial [Streptomyces javensis]|uniref:hypothetical protein n=1 Tax=Streptomyces javensis TaxID=114698 RepID=UPI001BE4B7C0